MKFKLSDSPLFFQKGGKVAAIKDTVPPEKKFEHLLLTQNEGQDQTGVAVICSLSFNLKPFDKIDDCTFKLGPVQFTVSRSKKKEAKKELPKQTNTATLIASPKKKCKFDEKLTAPSPIQQPAPQKVEEQIAEPEELV